MKKRLCTMLLCLCMVVGMLPGVITTAQAYNFNAATSGISYRAWSQDQLPWGQEMVGVHSSANFNDYGCLVTALAKIAVQSGQYTTSNMNPSIANQKASNFTDAGGYCTSYYAAAEAFGFTYSNNIRFDGIVNALRNNPNLQFILQVNAGGFMHYVSVNNQLTLQNGAIYFDDSSSARPNTGWPTRYNTNWEYEKLLVGRQWPYGCWSTYTCTDVLTFTPQGSPAPSQPTVSPLNLGDDFYATIYYGQGGKLLEAVDSGRSGYPVNVQLNHQYYASVDSTDPRCIWHFIRHGDDGSYKIVNEYYGYCLDVETGVAGPERNVGAWYEDHGDNPERWFICDAWGSDRGYSLLSALEYPSYALDVYMAYETGGTNVQIYYRGEANAAQQFNIVKQDSYRKPSRPAAPTFQGITSTPKRTSISWNRVAAAGTYDSREYVLNIFNKTTGQYAVSGYRTSSTSFSAQLPAGEYRAEVCAVNTRYRDYMSGYATRDFTVDAEVFFQVSTSATGGGTASGGGSYSKGASATVTASPQSGYHFVKWTEDGAAVSRNARYQFVVSKDRLLTAVFERDVSSVPEETDGPIQITPTNIQADRVINQEGYGSLIINGNVDIDEEDEFTGSPAQLALIDRSGSFVFPYRYDPVGDNYFVGDARFYCSDGIVSLTLGSCYYNGDIPQYYGLDGNRAFTLEPTDTGEYTDEDGVKRQEWTSWLGGPMQDGYAVVIQKLYSSWSNGWAGGGGGSGDNRTLIIDKTGAVTCVLPESYNEYTDWGAGGFGTRMSLGWCGEGLFAFVARELTYDEEEGYGSGSTMELLGYMDPSGKTAIDLKGQGYVNGWPFHEGLAAVKAQNGKIGFIDRTGALVIPCIYDGVNSFSDGLCGVLKDGKWGYIDKTGKTVIPFVYDGSYGSGGGLAAVLKDGKCGLVDYHNQVVVPLKYDDISSYEGGVAYGIKDGHVYLMTGYESVPTTPTTILAIPTNDKLAVDGKAAVPAAYKIDGNNYFKIRDVAALLDGTKAQFSVDWDPATNAASITTGQPYTRRGDELQSRPTRNDMALLSQDTIIIDGVKANLTIYKINGDNYFKLRDLGRALGFNAGWDAARGSMFIESDKPYTDAD